MIMKLSHREFLSLFLCAGLGAVSGCSSGKPQAISFPLGEKVTVGKLVYQVIEAKWLPEAEGAKEPPRNRILQLQVTITNGGGQEAAVPFLHLLDSKGNEIVELSDIENNSRWLGALRRLQPTITEEGTIYFDVPVGGYKLEVIDNTDAENEQTALIDIPASLSPPPVTPDVPKV